MSDPRYDPYYLRKQLFGRGRLVDRVERRIRSLYRTPTGPADYPTSSVPTTGAGGWTSSDPTEDIVELHDYLADWLRIDPRRPLRAHIDQDRLEAITARANRRARRVLERRHVTDDNRTRIHDLTLFYLRWLRRSCDHTNRDEGDQECPDCGLVTVERTATMTDGPTVKLPVTLPQQPRAAEAAKLIEEARANHERDDTYERDGRRYAMDPAGERERINNAIRHKSNVKSRTRAKAKLGRKQRRRTR